MKCNKWALIVLVFLIYPTILFSGVLKYSIIKKQDISFLNEKRIVYRVVLEVKSIPLEDELEQTALKIWQPNGKKWDEFTVFMYLPEMNTEDMAYCVAEINKNGALILRIQKNSLIGTKWQPQKELSTRPPGTNKTRTDFFIKISPEVFHDRRVRINIDTNFPDGTNMQLSVYRNKYLKGKEEAYYGEIFEEDFIIKNGQYSKTVLIDDSQWYSRHLQLVKDLPDDIMPIERISDSIKISVLYTPACEQPEEVEFILGEKGENVGGIGASDFGKIRIFRKEMQVEIPFNPKKQQPISAKNSNNTFYIMIISLVVLIFIIVYFRIEVKNRKTKR